MRKLRVCTTPGCATLVAGGGRCGGCARTAEQARGSAHQRGYGRTWGSIRNGYLAAHPICNEHDCQQPATDVDHVTPRAAGGTDQWDNLQALCHAHHSRKTATHDGGFGRASSGF